MSRKATAVEVARHRKYLEKKEELLGQDGNTRYAILNQMGFIENTSNDPEFEYIREMMLQPPRDSGITEQAHPLLQEFDKEYKKFRPKFTKDAPEFPDYLASLYPHKTRSRSKPTCVNPENAICMRGQFARYTQRRNYNELDENFDYVYKLMLTTLGINEPQDIVSLGIINIVVSDNAVSFKKDTWNDSRDSPNDDVVPTINIQQFEVLMGEPIFKSYINLSILKIVQDRLVAMPGERNVNFSVYLNFYYDRYLSSGDKFHQDHEDKLKVDYFTLTYIMPKDKVILGASLLVNPNSGIATKYRLEPGKYASLNVAVQNLTTLGFTNKDATYHSTPVSVSSREFRQKIGTATTSKYIEPERQRRPALLEVQTHGSLHEFISLDNVAIELVPLKMEILPGDEMGKVKKVLKDTMITRRSFIRCWYIVIGLFFPNRSSSIYGFAINIDELIQELADIQDINIENFSKHVIGGRKSKRANPKRAKSKIVNLSQLRKLLYNPFKNIRLR